MRNYLIILISIYSTICLGQESEIKSGVASNRFSKTGVSYLGIINLTNEYAPKNLYLNAGSLTKEMVNISSPNNPYTKLIFLKGVSKISFQSDISVDSLHYFKYSVIQDDTLVLVDNHSPKLTNIADNPIPNGFNADFGTYKISGKKLKISISQLGKRNNIKEVIIYNQEVEIPKILIAQLVKNNPSITKEVDFSDTVKTSNSVSISKGKKTITTSADEHIDLNVNGGVINLDKSYDYIDLSIERIENLFLYHIIIKRTNNGKTENIFLDNLKWSDTVYGTYRILLDQENFKQEGKYELIIYPKLNEFNINKIENSTSIKFELKYNTSFFKKKA